MHNLIHSFAGACLFSTGLLLSATVQAGQQTLSRTDIIYHILVAEMAVKRGHLEAALDYYRDAVYSSRDTRVAARATSIALFLNQNDDLLKLSERWHELAPDDEKARQSLILGLLRSKRLAAAIAQINAALASVQTANTDDQARLFSSLSTLFSQVKDPDTVFRVTASLRRHHAGQAEVHYFYALAAMDMKQDKEALAGLNEALTLKPQWQEARLLRARIMIRNDDADSALSDLEQAVADSPDDYQLHIGYARLLVAADKLERARAEFQKLAKIRPDDAEAQFALGVLAADAKQLDEAEAYFRRVLELDQRRQDTYFELGKLEEQRKNYRDAYKWYLLVSDDERFLSAQIRAAAMSAQLNDLDAMRERMTVLRRDNPDNAVGLYITESDILRDVKQYQDAFDLLSDAIEAHEGNEDLLYARALAAEKVNRLDIVERDLKLLIDADPDNGHALNALGYTLADRTERYEEALAYIERAIALLPDDAAVLDSMGWIKYRLGDHQEALDYLRRAYQLHPDPEIVSHLSEVLWVTGNHDEARTIWQEAFEQNPDSEHLLKIKGRFGFD